MFSAGNGLSRLERVASYLQMAVLRGFDTHTAHTYTNRACPKNRHFANRAFGSP
jgi:hypothetical protein